MTTKQQTTSSSARQEGCPQVLFSQEAGIFWLRGDNLTRAKKLLAELSAEQGAVGFDHINVKIYVDELTEQGVTVGIVRGNTVRTIIRQQTSKPEKVESRTVWLAPTLLLGQKELGCINHRLAGASSQVGDFIQTLQTTNPDSDLIREFGSLYVYQVAEDLYEIDWELTTIVKAMVEALALAAHKTGQLLCCELVAPKPKRIKCHRQTRKAAGVPTSQFVVSEPVAYGQLRFDI